MTYTNPDCYVPTGTIWNGSAGQTGLKLEGVHWYNLPEQKKRVLVCHREGADNYNLAHVLIVHLYANGGQPYAEMTYSGRPFGYESRDQRVWVDDDGTPYALTSQMGTVSFFKMDPEWRQPIEATNPGLWPGSYRETPDVIHVGDYYFFVGSRQNGWYPSQSQYATGLMGGTWTQLVNLGNAVGFDAQFNRFEAYAYGDGKKAVSSHSYRWAGSRDGIARGTTTQRMAIISVNGPFMALEYFPNIAFHQDHGLIGIRTGRNVSLGKRVVAAASYNQVNLSAITNGHDAAGPADQSYRNDAVPYSITVDLGKLHKLNEMTLTNKTAGGSDACVQFYLRGSKDGNTFSTIPLYRNGNVAVTGATYIPGTFDTATCNGTVGFIPLDIHTDEPYRYVRLTITGVINVRNNNALVHSWTGDIIDLSLFGMPAE
jgi:hypothetical protein